jgi:hypothetical protein
MQELTQKEQSSGIIEENIFTHEFDPVPIKLKTLGETIPCKLWMPDGKHVQSNFIRLTAEQEGSTGSIPLAITGDLVTAQKVIITCPGIGLPSVILEESAEGSVIASYYNRGVGKLAKEGWASVNILNWPGYGGISEASCDFTMGKPDPQSLLEKAKIVKSITKWVLEQHPDSPDEPKNNLQKLVIDAHSSGANAVLRAAASLEKIDERIVVSCGDVSGHGADEFIPTMFGLLSETSSKAAKKAYEVILGFKNLAVWLYADTYNLPVDFVKNHPWIMETLNLENMPLDVLTKELVSEKKCKKLSREALNRLDGRKTYLYAGRGD